MRITIAAAALLLITACRGEKPPRDYQNAPPAMRHPPMSSTQTPTVNGMRGASAEPSKGAEGSNVTGQPASPIPPTEKLKNQAPVTTTHR